MFVAGNTSLETSLESCKLIFEVLSECNGQVGAVLSSGVISLARKSALNAS